MPFHLRDKRAKNVPSNSELLKTAGFTGIHDGGTEEPPQPRGDRIPRTAYGTAAKAPSSALPISPNGRPKPSISRKAKSTGNHPVLYGYARIMKEGLESTGLKVYGGVNAPYLWVKPRMEQALGILRPTTTKQTW